MQSTHEYLLGEVKERFHGKRNAPGFPTMILRVAGSGTVTLPATSWTCWTSDFPLTLGFCMSTTVSMWNSSRARTVTWVHYVNADSGK